MRVVNFLSALALTIAMPAFAVPTWSQAPDFTLKGHDGKTYKLSDLKGKTVVLEWFNNDCPYVKKHYDAGNMQALQKRFTAQNVAWFTVNSSAAGEPGHLTAVTAA